MEDDFQIKINDTTIGEPAGSAEYGWLIVKKAMTVPYFSIPTHPTTLN